MRSVGHVLTRRRENSSRENLPKLPGRPVPPTENDGRLSPASLIQRLNSHERELRGERTQKVIQPHSHTTAAAVDDPDVCLIIKSSPNLLVVQTVQYSNYYLLVQLPLELSRKSWESIGVFDAAALR